ncbi:MAG: sulfatase-like hydrolase/transferase [Actinomycetota bacterium]
MSARRGWGRTGIVTSLSIVLGVAATAAWPVGPRIDRSSATAAPQPAQLGLDPSPSPTDSSPSPTEEPAGPNIVVILTDDQRADELREMDTVRTELVDRGLLFERAFNTNPLCCPARASLLTGLYSHHTGVWTNGDEGGELGGYPAFQSNGNESRTIAAVLDDAGYHTGLVGKYLNNAVDTPVPAGWDSWVAFNEDNGRYFDYELVVDTDTADAVAPTMEAHAGEAGDYSTDVLAQRAIAFVEEAPADVPLFLLLATYAPHGVSTPALRHEGIFADLPVALG